MSSKTSIMRTAGPYRANHYYRHRNGHLGKGADDTVCVTLVVGHCSFVFYLASMRIKLSLPEWPTGTVSMAPVLETATLWWNWMRVLRLEWLRLVCAP